VHGLSAGSVAA